MKLRHDNEVALWVELVKNAPYTYEDAKRIRGSQTQRDRHPTVIETLAELNADYTDFVLRELKERL